MTAETTLEEAVNDGFTRMIPHQRLLAFRLITFTQRRTGA
jgi:hypothetical protein